MLLMFNRWFAEVFREILLPLLAQLADGPQASGSLRLKPPSFTERYSPKTLVGKKQEMRSKPADHIFKTKILGGLVPGAPEEGQVEEGQVAGSDSQTAVATCALPPPDDEPLPATCEDGEENDLFILDCSSLFEDAGDARSQEAHASQVASAALVPADVPQHVGARLVTTPLRCMWKRPDLAEVLGESDDDMEIMGVALAPPRSELKSTFAIVHAVSSSYGHLLKAAPHQAEVC